MIEIERKYLVKNDSFISLSTKQFAIAQGYLSTDPERTVRVRLRDHEAFLTIKGKSSADGLSRSEWEYRIPVTDAQEMLQRCAQPPIEKIRYIIPFGKYNFEVDVFLGANQGLIIAELELDDAQVALDLPDWIGEEVTGVKKYYNAYLSKHPYGKWL